MALTKAQIKALLINSINNNRGGDNGIEDYSEALSDILWQIESGTSFLPFQELVFANPLVVDAVIYKDFVCYSITGNTVVDIYNTVDGDAGMLELIIDNNGGHTVTLGSTWTKQMGEVVLVLDANTDNVISWRNVIGDIVYTIAQIV